MSLFWLRVAAVCYAAGLLHAFLTILRKQPTLYGIAYRTFRIGFVLHLVGVVELAVASGSIPAHNFFETSAVCALLIAGLFLFVNWRYQFHGLGVFLFPLVFVLTLAAGMGSPVQTWSSSYLRDAWLLTHVVLICGGFAAMLLMAAASVGYLAQERHLKKKQVRTPLFDRLPALRTLDSLINNSMNIGFVLITLGTITAAIWAFVESGTGWIGDPRIIVSFSTWGFYLILIYLRIGAGWRGRRTALLSIVLLLCSVTTWATHYGLRPLLER